MADVLLCLAPLDLRMTLMVCFDFTRKCERYARLDRLALSTQEQQLVGGIRKNGKEHAQGVPGQDSSRPITVDSRRR